MLLSGELARFGVDVRLLERRPVAGIGTRAIGVHAPVLAALEESGITERLLAHALRVTRGEARSGEHRLGTVHFDRLSTRFPFVATLPQVETETVLAAAAPSPERGREVTAVQSREGDVRLRISHIGGADDGASEETSAPLVVVASGWTARSLVYRQGAVPSTHYPDRYLMADIAVPVDRSSDTAIVNLAPGGVLESFPLPGSMRRVVAWDSVTPTDEDPAAQAERLRTALRTRGEAPLADAVVKATTFGIRRVLAPAFRRGRLFVIGDTAHEVSPIGGQGMNLGLLDAAGLAPLLARWVHDGAAPEAQLRAWERRRLISATRAGRLAAVNTVLGRPRSGAADVGRRTLVRSMLAAPWGGAFAWAYAMGMDAGA